jgi:hypothetical protein
MPIYGISRQPGLAIAMCCAPLSLDRCAEVPSPEMIGQIVMIAALGKIVGCARFTGIVTLEGERFPTLEHRNADAIRRSLAGKQELFGAQLWVYEDGIVFDYAVPVAAGRSGSMWQVPDTLRVELEEARRVAAFRQGGDDP